MVYFLDLFHTRFTSPAMLSVVIKEFVCNGATVMALDACLAGAKLENERRFDLLAKTKLHHLFFLKTTHHFFKNK